MNRTLRLQNSSVRRGDNKLSEFFIDKEIILDADLKWNGNIINEIIFTLRNLGGKTYRICEVKVCNINEARFGNFIAIHLNSLAGDPNVAQVFPADSNKLGLLELQQGKYATFLFIVDDKNEACETTFGCDINQLTPKTKDGTIIVSI